MIERLILAGADHAIVALDGTVLEDEWAWQPYVVLPLVDPQVT